MNAQRSGTVRPRRERCRDANRKKTASTARRIRRSAFSQLLAIVVLVDALGLFLAVAGWCYQRDSTYLDGETRLVNLTQTVERRFSLVRTDAGRRVYYVMEASGRAPAAADATSYFQMLAVLLLGAASGEMLLLFLCDLLNRIRIRRQLRPLDALAEAAQRLSESGYGAAGTAGGNKAAKDARPRNDDGRAEHIQSLENAIGRLSPASPGSRLHTGDASLAGLENAINGMLDRMQQAYSQQTRFVSDASHELRTPIAVIKGYADLLARWGKQDEKVLDEGIAAIRTEAERMGKLVEQLLFLARGDSGRTQLKLRRIQLAPLVSEVYEESEMIHPEHVWQFQCVDAAEADADDALLKQAVRILVDNAVKYTKPGERIRLRVLRGADGAPCIEVQDSGIGISEEDMTHVFERFFRADPARNAGTGGTGLGLAIAKWIVDRHGGHFELRSEPGAGTRITICLPKPSPTAA